MICNVNWYSAELVSDCLKCCADDSEDSMSKVMLRNRLHDDGDC